MSDECGGNWLFISRCKARTVYTDAILQAKLLNTQAWFSAFGHPTRSLLVCYQTPAGISA